MTSEEGTSIIILNSFFKKGWCIVTVRDWKRNAEESVANNKIVKMFHATSIELYLQRLYLYKYLLENNVDKTEAWNKWKNLVFDSEIEKELIDSEFDYYTKAALNKNWVKRPKIDFYITKEEINHINQIKASKEFRIFILGMIIYGKYSKQQIGVPLFGPYDRSYIYYLVNKKDDFNYGKRREKFINKMLSRKDIGINLNFYSALLNLNSRSFVKSFPKTVETFDGDWIDWNKRAGFHVTNLDEDISKIVDQIEDYKVPCHNCQQLYVPSSRAKTLLCPNCYILQRREYKTLKERQRRAKNEGCGQEKDKC